MDDTNSTAVNQPSVAEASNVEASPATEPTTSSAPVVDAPVSEATTTADPSAPAATAPVVDQPTEVSQPAPERQPQRPAQRRIQELVAETKQLKEQLSNTVPLPDVSPQAPKLSELVGGKDYIDPAELDQVGQKLYDQAAQTAQGKASLELQQLRNELKLRDAINETTSTALELSSQFKELNPSSPEYNPALESKIVRRYQQEAVRTDPNTGQKFFDPSIKLTDVAKDEVESFHEAVEFGKTQASANLSSQADSAAITPTVSTPVPEKSFDDMSLEEQETYLRAKGHDI